jgi:hypothetical protein
LRHICVGIEKRYLKWAREMGKKEEENESERRERQVVAVVGKWTREICEEARRKEVRSRERVTERAKDKARQRTDR